MGKEKPDKPDKTPKVKKVYQSNPFLNGKIRMGQKNTGMELVDRDTGETRAVYTKTPIIIEGKWVKFFTGSAHLFKGVEKWGYDILFMYIAKGLEPGSDRIAIDYKKIMGDCGFDYPLKAYRGVKSLEDAGIIARSASKKMWWVNTNVIANGRVKKKE